MYARYQTDDFTNLSDSDLLHLAKSGDYDSLNALLSRHSEALFLHCCRLTSNRFDAEDICQEAMARAISSVESLESAGAFRTWLFRIARNVSVDSFRRVRRLEPMPEGDSASFVSQDIGPDELLETTEEHEMVAHALRTLKQSHQEVLLMREVEGMSYADIARRLDVSQSAVETRLFRARRRLKEQYSKAAFARLVVLAPLRNAFFRLSAPLVEGTSLAGKVVGAVTLAGAGVVTISHIARLDLGGAQLALAAHSLEKTFNPHALASVSSNVARDHATSQRSSIQARNALYRRTALRTRPMPAATITGRSTGGVVRVLHVSPGTRRVDLAASATGGNLTKVLASVGSVPATATTTVSMQSSPQASTSAAASHGHLQQAAAKSFEQPGISAGVISQSHVTSVQIRGQTGSASLKSTVGAAHVRTVHPSRVHPVGTHHAIDKSAPIQSGRSSPANRQLTEKHPAKMVIAQPSKHSNQRVGNRPPKSVSTHLTPPRGQRASVASTTTPKGRSTSTHGHAVGNASSIRAVGSASDQGTVAAKKHSKQTVQATSSGGRIAGNVPASSKAQAPTGRATTAGNVPATSNAQASTSRTASAGNEPATSRVQTGSSNGDPGEKKPSPSGQDPHAAAAPSNTTTASQAMAPSVPTLPAQGTLPARGNSSAAAQNQPSSPGAAKAATGPNAAAQKAVSGPNPAPAATPTPTVHGPKTKKP